MEIAAKARFAPELPGGFGKLFHHNIRISKDAGGKEKPFDIISAVKLAGKPHQFVNRKGCTLGISGGAVYAVSAVEAAGIGKKHFQETYAAAVFCPAMADPCRKAIAKFSPRSAAGLAASGRRT